MKRVIIAVVLLLGITTSSIVWMQSCSRHFRPLQQLAAAAGESFAAGNTDEALQKATELAREYERSTRFFDLFISHQTLLEAERSIKALPLILQYGDEKDFINEAKRCELLLERLWEQELPLFDNIF